MCVSQDKYASKAPVIEHSSPHCQHVSVHSAPVQAEDQGDSVTFMFEAANQERISDFELKLMDIDSEQ